jgi:hypothetical protein
MGNEIVNWKERMAEQAKAVAAVERPSVAALSFRNGRMSYLGQPVPGDRLKCVVVSAIMEHRYFSKKFDPNQPDAPDCFAFSETGEGMVPHDLSFKKQHDNCLECPKNQWGSDTLSQSGKGKACKEIRKLAILPVSWLKGGSDEMAIASLPPTSVKNWGNYVNTVASKVARPYWGVVTEIAVLPHPKNQFEIKFELVEEIPDEYLGRVGEKIEIALKCLTIPYEKTEAGLSEQEKARASNKKY